MQIVTDSGYDLSPEQTAGIPFHTLPLKITLDGVTYRSGVDIQPEAFYDLLASTDAMPTTSTPSPGEFKSLYEDIAAEDPDILSIHISSGLSGTYSAAATAAEGVSGANITLVDTRTLSAEMGWQIEAALKGLRAGWALDRIQKLMADIRAASEMIFTLPDLSYLIHGGRISHLKGLLASLLGIKPLISVDKSEGRYDDIGRSRTFKRALKAIPETMAKKLGEGIPLRAQVGHAGNPEGAADLKAAVDQLFPCEWLPECAISPVLGAHTGRGLVGLVYTPLSNMPDLP
jgi:DegV family protein with EDD domain